MGNKNSGRRPKSEHRAKAELCLFESAPEAARYLKEVVNGVTKPQPGRIEAAKYTLDQCMGKPRQRMEHTGEEGTPIRFLEIRDGAEG